MNNIKKLIINGFKIFKNFEIEFNSGPNIIIGENECGKSTILEALDIVFNKKYSNFDKYIVKDFINKDNIQIFENSKKYEDLPKIEIYVILNLDRSCHNDFEFYGDNGYDTKVEEFGIKFVCKFNDEFKTVLLPTINSGKIPYEYYDMNWETFRGDQYNVLKRPIRYLSIDNSKVETNNTFNYYNKSLFNTRFDEAHKMSIKNEFRTKINELFDSICDENLDSNRKFGIDNKKIILENILSVFEKDIPIDNMGKGKENLIKTEIALSKHKNNAEVISIEEPENHLSHTNLRKMLEDIKNTVSDSTDENEIPQIIVTTHNSLIVTSLNISNVLWIDKNEAKNLSKLSENVEGKKVSEFFEKTDNLNLLQFLISDKVILVEGATEYMVIQKAFKDLNINNSLEKSKIDIISCDGIGYKNYITIAKTMDKKVAIITDNDYITNQNKIKEIEEINSEMSSENKNIKIFTDNNTDNWTWEVSIYNLNKELFDTKIKVQKGSDYLVNGEDFGKQLGKMLNNKTDIAYMITKDNLTLQYPEYIKDCLKWINE